MMSENKFDSYISRKNGDAESKVFSLKSDVQPLVYVKIPKNNKNMAPSFTISKTKLPGSTTITLGTKQTSQIGASKSDHTRTVTVSPSQTSASKITMRAINSFTSSQIKVSTANCGPASNLCEKSLIRSNTVPSISGIVVSSVSGTVMSHSIQTSARTSLTLVNSGSALKLSPGIIRSPTHSPMVQISKSSPKPLILQSKIVPTVKKSPNIAMPSNINNSKQGLQYNRSNNVLQSSSPILHSNISNSETLSKNQFPKKGGSTSCLWSPTPLILQSGRNLKTVCKSGPAAISIVTGKGSHGNNTISVIPLARKGLSRRNMVNLKIANGQIVSDSSHKIKVDGMAPVCDSQSVSVTSLNHPQDSLLEDTLHSRSENEGSTTFFRRASSDGSKPKDILEEAMCAMASDIDDISFVEGDSNDQYTSFTKTSHDSVGSLPKPKYANAGDNNRHAPKIVVPDQLPLLESTSVLMPGTSSTSLLNVSNLTETAVPINSVQPSKAPIPISIPFTASTELPGLIIRTDSVTVRRKISKDESKKESLKPDLSIIPILRNSSGENSPIKKNSRANIVDVEKFADGKSTLDLLQGSFINLGHVKNEGNFDAESGKPSSTMRDNSSIHGFDEELEAVEEQDFSKILKWQNGMAALTDSDLKFQVNEFGAVELVDDAAVDVIKEAVKDECESSVELLDSISIQNKTTPTIHIHHARKPNHHKDIKKDDEMDMVSDSDHLTQDFYDICCCKNCGCYGLCSEFLKEKGISFCTISCSEEYEVKEIEWNKEKIKLEKNKIKSKKFKQEDVDAVTKFETNAKENVELQQFLTTDKESKIDPLDIDVKLNVTWKGSKQSFSWVKYLEQCGKNKGLSRAAPLKLWTEPFPFGRNLFKAGMKVEGIDPQHQSLFCVMTVVDVIGHRIRLHFDGYSSINDFWCNDSSPNIFQVGWCEKNGRKLETPPGIANFTWKAYLEHCKVAPGPKQAFSTRSCTTVTTPSNFRIGMKLEAEDRKNGWTCVATVADVLDTRILVHFDGWEKAFDTWFDVNSPFIHPVGWCSTNGVFLFPPKDYSDPDNFSWHEYIQETNSVAVPARAFKTRAPKNFKKDMKIECVDKRNPMLVRVATIIDIKGYKLKIHFDGWSNEYDYWVDDDSPDIHPPTWCSKTGHPLQPPLNLDIDEKNIDLSNGCGTPGCKGYGHMKGLIYCSHHTSYGCPYSLQNLDKDWEALLPDRLESSSFEKTASKQIINLDESKPIPIDQDEEDLQKKRVRKRRKFFDELSPPECSKIKIPRMSSEELRIPVLSNFKSNNSATCTYYTRHSASSNENPVLKPVSEEGRIDSIVHQSIFNPFYHPKPPVPRPLTLEAHKKFVAGKDVPKLESEKWTSKEVRQFISAIAGCSLVAKKFTEHKIDGKSLLMMTQQDLIDILGIKLGPAIKIMASIISVRNTL